MCVTVNKSYLILSLCSFLVISLNSFGISSCCLGKAFVCWARLIFFGFVRALVSFSSFGVLSSALFSFILLLVLLFDLLKVIIDFLFFKVGVPCFLLTFNLFSWSLLLSLVSSVFIGLGALFSFNQKGTIGASSLIFSVLLFEFVTIDLICWLSCIGSLLLSLLGALFSFILLLFASGFRILLLTFGLAKDLW